MRYFSVLFLCCGLAAQHRVGNYEVSVRPPDGGLFAAEDMRLVLRIVDRSKEDPVMGPRPVIRAEVEGVIDMPSMKGMPKIQETAYPDGVPGEYAIEASFLHGGEYRLTLRVAPPKAEPFVVEIPLEVGDARPEGAKPRYRLEVSGSPSDLRLRVVSPEGPVTVFDLVHEREMHLIAVRHDLRVFEHVHPERQRDGSFRLRHKWAAGGEYSLFADVAPAGKGSQILRSQLTVPGPGAPPPAKDSGLRFETPASVPAKKTVPLTVKIAPAVELQPYLGEMGHLMIVSADAQMLVHSHPVAYQPGEIRFLARLPARGKYRAWLEVQRNGKVIAHPFDLEAQ